MDCRELRLINLSTSERKSRELLLTLVPRTPISLGKKNSYLPSVRRWHRPNSVSAREASASSGARSPLTPPVGKKEDGHSAGWLSGPLCPIPPPPQHPTVAASTLPTINKGVCFPLPLWCVTLGCRFVFNMCDRIHLTGRERKWGDFAFFFLSLCVKRQQPLNKESSSGAAINTEPPTCCTHVWIYDTSSS